MAQDQTRPLRKVSGGRYRRYRTKRKYELGGFPAMTRLGERKIKMRRIVGGHYKPVLLSAKEVNVSDQKGKTQKTEILNVVENPANPNLVRRNVITKGAVVETKLGRVRVTSRPGQEGTVNGVLV
ncbi:30S ribosomal protein S8e [Candidatus Woesearchaeota archaeon]|nr:30S ribosomal protein S8e [Candidatus Woesearchaeota archaeon]